MTIYQDKISKGMAAEFRAAEWLVKQGYSIYWRTKDNDPIDFVAVEQATGNVLKIDAKCASIRKTWKPGTMINRKVSTYQKLLGVKIIYVFKNGECKFAENKRSHQTA
tara:strand:- start:1034 stop:1357 length:324 start_codon:yes stop_codon:yes gene_type:complete